MGFCASSNLQLNSPPVFSDNGISIICFSLAQFLKKKDEEIAVIRFWLQSVALYSRETPVFMVGTHSKGVSKNDLRLVDKVLYSKALAKYTQLALASNRQDGLYFFPLDNAGPVGKLQALNNLRVTIEEVMTGNHRYVNLKALNKSVKLAWVYLIDVLIRESSHLSLEEVYTRGNGYGFKEKEVEEMLNFYHECGSILFFFEKFGS